MIVKPSEAPSSDELEVSAALDKVSNWRLPNGGARKKAAEGVNFVRENRKAIFSGISEAYANIERMSKKK